MVSIRGRAATPATVFLLAAFVLLLLSCISVPITKTIALGSFNGATFGVFGFCVNGKCSSVQLGYNPDGAIKSVSSSSSSSSSKRSIYPRQGGGAPPPTPLPNNNNNFSLPPSARNGLSNILIVHVIAAALTFVALILSLIAHIRSPSHSVRFLLAIFIITILTTILTLLSFLVDLLVFVPHFAVGTWFVLAATICNAVSTILLCCGRRTLIARKAMRRRIAENAEMSGTNYYKEEASKDMALRSSDQSKAPQYAEFEVSKPVTPDRLPLNPSQTHVMTNSGGRTGSDRSGETFSTVETSIPGSYTTRVGLPSGPSPYGGGGYPPAVRMPRPYAGVPPVRMPNPNESRAYPPGNAAGMGIPPSRSNASLNSMNRQPPRSNYDVPPPALPPPVGLDRHASSVYSDYVPPRRQWGAPPPAESRSLNDEGYASDPNRYRPERPRIDTYNLDRNIDNPYVAARRTPDPDIPVQSVSPSRNRRTSDTGTVIASYYEDVDPRFDDTPEEEEVEPPNAYRPPLPLNPSHRRRPSRDLPDETSPSGGAPLRRNYSYNSLDGNTRNNNNPNNNVDDEYRSGPRSPAASTSSHFTSVSQRGINPRWQPQPQPPQFIGGPPPAANEYPSSRRQNRAPRNDQMNFLSGNPDFELPVNRAGKRPGGGGGAGTSPIDAGGRYPLPR